MKSRNIITKEQREYRNALLRKKQRPEKVLQSKILEPIPRETYMSNCLYSITDYFSEHGTDKERAKLGAIHLKRYCEEIINQLQQP